MQNELKLFKQSIEDFLSPKMLKFALLPLLISVTILYTFFFILTDIGLEKIGTVHVNTVQTTVENGVVHTDQTDATLQGGGIVDFLLHNSVTSGITEFIVYTVGSLMTLYLSIFVAISILGFLTPYILKALQKKHYPDIEMKGYGNIFESLFLMVKWVFVMVFLFILLSPLYLVPGINLIVINIPLYYFFHKTLTYDISSNICTKEEAKEIEYFYKNSLRAKTLLLYMLSLIPFTIFFTTIFFVIYLGNSYFEALKQKRITH